MTDNGFARLETSWIGERELSQIRMCSLESLGRPHQGPVRCLRHRQTGFRDRVRLRRERTTEYTVAAADVVLPPRTEGERYLAMYRKWLGLESKLPEAVSKRSRREHKAAATAVDLGRPVELVALSIKDRAASADLCEAIESSRFALAAFGTSSRVRSWSSSLVSSGANAGHPYLSGEIVSTRLEVPARLWGHIDKRPFLRCAHGYGLCCWRLDRFEEAERIFERMLWLNPSDNQGARFLIGGVQARKAWTAG
jgi:tetratricopeptide (TPR) repeat protein